MLFQSPQRTFDGSQGSFQGGGGGNSGGGGRGRTRVSAFFKFLIIYKG